MQRYFLNFKKMSWIYTTNPVISQVRASFIERDEYFANLEEKYPYLLDWKLHYYLRLKFGRSIPRFLYSTIRGD